MRYELRGNGNKIWRNSAGQYHCTDGPAIEWADGTKYWWYEGEKYTEEEYNSKNFK